MLDRTNQPFDVYDHEQLARFRYEIAGIVRDLIAARLQAEPNAFDKTTRAKWFSGTSKPTTTPIRALLISLATKFKLFRETYCGYLDSDPGDGFSNRTGPRFQVSLLRSLVLEFVDPDVLENAAQQLAKKSKVNWQDLAQWDSLDQIRELLDRLPVPQSRSVARPQVGGESCRAFPPDVLQIGTREWQGLTNSQLRLLEFLLPQEKMSATKEDVVEHLWQDDQKDRSGALKSLVARMGQWFENNGVPLTVRQAKKYVIVERSELGETPMKRKRSGSTKRKR